MNITPIYKTISVIDHKATGEIARKMRTESGMPRWQVVVRTGLIDLEHLSLLERGEIPWTEERFQRFVRVLQTDAC